MKNVKIAVILLGLLGASLMLGFGIRHLRALNSHHVEVESISNKVVRAQAIDVFNSSRNADYICISFGLLALVGIAVINKLPWISGGILGMAPIMPAVFRPLTLGYSFPLFIAAGLLFFIIEQNKQPISSKNLSK